MKKLFATVKTFLSLIIVLACTAFFATNAEAQYLDNLTDAWSKAPTAAYSTRKVISTYSGPAMKLRRSSDNVEIDVFFDANGWVSLSSNVGTAASGNMLVDWVGLSSAFVTKWYDQSGNLNHATSVECSGTINAVTAGTAIAGTGTAFNVELAAGTNIYSVSTGALLATVGAAAPASATAFTAASAVTIAAGTKFFTRESQPRFISGGVIDAMPNGRPALYLNEVQNGVSTSGLTTPMILSADANVNVFAVAKRTQHNSGNNVALVLGNWTNFNTASAGNFSVGFWNNVGLATRSTITTSLATVLNQPFATQFYINAKKAVTTAENTGIVQLDAAGVTTSSPVVAGATAFTNSTKLNLFRPISFAPRALMGYCPEVIYYASTTDDAVFNTTDATALQAAQKASYMDAVAASPAVTVQVGASQTYPTIQAAYNALPSLITSPYIIELQSDYVSSSETFPITMVYKSGASMANTITIRPAVGVSATFSGTTVTPIFKLNGSKYVIIDGRSGGEGSTKSITIENKSADASASTILMSNSATGNKIQYCTVLGSAVSTTSIPTSGTIVIGSTTETVAGCAANVVDNCDVANASTGLPTVGVYLVGSTGFTTEGSVVTNNNISNYFNPGAFVSSGVYVGVLAQASTITGNKLFQTATRTYTDAGLHYPINISATTSVIVYNTIGYSSSAGTGTMTIDGTFAHRCVGININKPVTTLQGNTISDIDYTSSSVGGTYDGVLAGIYYTDGNLPTVIQSKPTTIRNLKLRFTSNTPMGIVGLSYYAFNGSANIAYTSVSNLQAIPAGDNANTIAGNVIGIYSFGPYGGSNKFNTVSNLSCGAEGSSAAHQVTGISANTGSNQALTSERNMVYNLNAISTGASVITGINCSAGTATATFKNNIVNLGNEVTSPAEIRGIYKLSVGKDVMYHNTIYIGGTTSGTTANTYAYYRNTATPTVIGEAVQNNIFVNKRTGGATGMHYALKMLNAADYSGGFIACTYNLLQVADDASAKLAYIGVDIADFAAFNSSFSNFATGSKNADPMFVAPTSATPDMHISSPGSQANQTGMVIASVTDDYYGLLRADYTPVDMGAVVISGSTTIVKNTNQIKLNVYAVVNSIIFNNLSGSTATIYSLNGQLLKSVSLTSDKVSVPSAKGCYIVKVGTENAKVLVK